MKKRLKGLFALWLILTLVVNVLPVTATAEEAPEQAAVLAEGIPEEREMPEAEPGGAEAEAEDSSEEKPDGAEAEAEDSSEEKPDGAEAETGDSSEEKPGGAEAEAEDSSEEKPDGAEAETVDSSEEKPDGAEAEAEDSSEEKPGETEAEAEDSSEEKPGGAEAETGGSPEEKPGEKESAAETGILNEQNKETEGETPKETTADSESAGLEAGASSSKPAQDGITPEETKEAVPEEKAPEEETTEEEALLTELLTPLALEEEDQTEGTAYLYTGDKEIRERDYVKEQVTEITLQFGMSFSKQSEMKVTETEEKKLDGWNLWGYNIESGTAGTISQRKGIDESISASEYQNIITQEGDTIKGLLLVPLWRTVRENIIDGDSLLMSAGDSCVLSSGSWSVDGDATLYTLTGTQTVYAAKSETYTFHRKQ